MHLSHTAIQKAVIKSIPGARMEHPFPSIKRVADIVYFPKKIIFEIQCSSISLKEVQKRNYDYESLGFTVIWILHDRLYNKNILTPAELYLRQNLSYFTSITPYGHGFFYDQLEFFSGMERFYRSKPYVLKGLLPKKLDKIPYNFPKILKEKLGKHPFYMLGDVPSQLIHEKKGRWAKELEKTFLQKRPIKKRITAAFHALLKKNACSSSEYKS